MLSAKVAGARDFAALRKKFPSLKGNALSFRNPLLKEIDGGPFNKEQAVRVYLWNKQGNDIPDMSKRDINRLIKAVEADPELSVFADELQLIQKSKQYPAPGKNWLGGSIKNDILDGLDTSFRAELMKEFNENFEVDWGAYAQKSIVQKAKPIFLAMGWDMKEFIVDENQQSLGKWL